MKEKKEEKPPDIADTKPLKCLKLNMVL